MSLWYNIKSKFLSWASDIRIYPGGFILFGESSYQIKGPAMRQIIEVLIPGDVMLRRYSHYLGSVIIPGYFSHATIYIGDDSVIHMLGEGITQEDILTFLRCDDIIILRPIDRLLPEQAIMKAKDLLTLKIPYDYDFTNDTDKLYCTEFIDDIFDNPVWKKNGGKKIMPDDFLRCGIFEIIWTKPK
jgi:hypothetical protein